MESKLMVATVRKSLVAHSGCDPKGMACKHSGPGAAGLSRDSSCLITSSRPETSPMLGMVRDKVERVFYPNRTGGSLLMPNKPPMYVHTHINQDAKA